MATLSSAGIGSNLPIDNMISQLMAVESRPLQQLNTKEATVQAQISALGQVKGALSSFQSATKALQDSSKFNASQATSSSEENVKVSGSNTAGTGSFLLRVDQLAQSQKLATSAFASTTTAIGGGTLTFSFGTTSGASFALNPEKVPKTVTIPAGSTLAGIRDAVNKANIGVTASIVNDGTGNRLVYTTATGTKSTLKVESSDSSLAAFAHDPAGTKLTEVQAAQDAKFELDGMTITKQSNTVSDAVDGLTFTLLKPHEATDTPAKIDVSRSSSGISKAIQDFVKSYNELEKVMDEVSKVDTSAKPAKGEQRTAPPLAGDASIRAIRSQIRAAFSAVQNVDGEFKRPAEIGLAFDKNGSLALNTTKLQAAIDSNPEDVLKLFGSVGTPTDGNIKFSAATGNTQTGNYAINLTAVQNGTLLGGAIVPSSITIAAAPALPPSFTVKINGDSSGSLTLPAATYTPATLASKLQEVINADSNLTTKGDKVTVSVDSSGKLLLSSTKTGTSSTVEISGLSNVALDSGSINLFNDGAGVAGADKVSGTLGGYAALADGNKLTGASGTPVEGLSVTVNGGTIGDRGTVEFSKGFAFALDGVLTSLLASKTGVIDAKTDGLNTTVKRIGEQRDRMSDRLTKTEARYRKQFNALDATVSQMQSTGNYLTQQLAALTKSS
ncbi:flagellar filament capping protein FliD [Vogesella sp. GCM10023246]|uniref:Flagellar hook-associated protein 2 n=1 Tax=Vogesella oryzagri TaxID=3160864 RepID=A0ABV1M7R7_9NEIS